jgi:hypothetical protein
MRISEALAGKPLREHLFPPFFGLKTPEKR